MSANTTGRLLTAEDLLSMPDDGKRYELVQGELKTMSPSGQRHGRIAQRFASRLAPFVEERGLGVVYAAETGFRLASNPDTVRAPDVAFVGRARVEKIGDVEGFWPGAPDLAVEVLSPGDTYTEVEEKALVWLQAGARIVIVVDPRKNTLTVYRSRGDIKVLSENEAFEAPDLIPGWSLRIAEVFR
ncbi:MAG TPA: Uma2 family endonuclease [Vicinamibacteria bacterium]